MKPEGCAYVRAVQALNLLKDGKFPLAMTPYNMYPNRRAKIIEVRPFCSTALQLLLLIELKCEAPTVLAKRQNLQRQNQRTQAGGGLVTAFNRPSVPITSASTPP